MIAIPSSFLRCQITVGAILASVIVVHFIVDDSCCLILVSNKSARLSSQSQFTYQLSLFLALACGTRIDDEGVSKF